MKIDNEPDIADFDAALLLVMDAIWSARNVSLAARRLHRSQSTISASLNRLRELLKDQVFVWDGRQMNPTALTEQLMPQVSDIIASMRALIWRAHGGAEHAHRRFVIATSSYVTALFSAGLLTRVADEMPGVSLDFIATAPNSWTKSVLPDIDLFIVPTNVARTRGLHTARLYQDAYVCIGARDNAQLVADMAPDDFLGLRHVGFSSVPRLTASHEASHWHALGITPNYVMQTPEYLSLPAIVAATDTVAIVPGRLAQAAMRDFALKAVRPPVPVPDLEIVMVWKPAQNDDPVHAWLRGALVDLAMAFDA
ncbi:LysR family transcriptional regulator [Phenylobacterium immobile]|uniref:LysR family transcriptional regulator n=1 Tax=Phenylobacterium immobile TaxID=21 RepID=UPI000AD341CB|nr:LysR family transcriptional regulator [Phenylobacterium immobile]